jgi:F420-non-reducing hydrogenase iron-sulfur subunit
MATATKTKSKKTKKLVAEFKPKILVFACNWCSYAGADNAGVNRMQYPPDIRVIRTMCSGRVNPGHIIDAFRMGADGVLWSGCHFGDCHYTFGNYEAEKNYKKLVQILNLLGVHPKRYRLEWVSAAEGNKWAALIAEFVNDIKQLGPSPHKAPNGRALVQMPEVIEC